MPIFISRNFRKTVNWKSAHKYLLNLQNRIVKQIEKKNYRKVRDLQRLILKHFSSRLIASQKIIENKDLKKFNLYKIRQNDPLSNVFNLNNYIELEKFLFSGPFSFYFQFLYLLWTLALLPLHETCREPFSYNYRLYRDHTDILRDLCQIVKKPKFKWILIIKPEGFFSRKNKKWLFQNAFIEKQFFIRLINTKEFANFSIKDYKYNQNLIETTKISLTKIVKNFSLQGYNSFSSGSTVRNTLEEEILSNKLMDRTTSELYSGSILYYNNLLLIPNKHLTELNLSYKSLFKFLGTRGLIIKKNRIWVLSLNEGFNFLGWFIKKDKQKLTLKISYQNIRSHQLEIKRILKSSRFLSIDKVINRLNEKIIKWQSYYAYTPNLSRTWAEMNYYLFWRIWRWCKKRHKNKGSKWIYKKYWHSSQNKKWIFHYNNQYLRSYDFMRKNMISLNASINACKVTDLKKIQYLLFQKYLLL